MVRAPCGASRGTEGQRRSGPGSSARPLGWIPCVQPRPGCEHSILGGMCLCKGWAGQAVAVAAAAVGAAGGKAGAGQWRALAPGDARSGAAESPEPLFVRVPSTAGVCAFKCGGAF